MSCSMKTYIPPSTSNAIKDTGYRRTITIPDSLGIAPGGPFTLSPLKLPEYTLPKRSR